MKTMMRYHYIPIRIASIATVKTSSTGEVVEKLDLSDNAGEGVSCKAGLDSKTSASEICSSHTFPFPFTK